MANTLKANMAPLTKVNRAKTATTTLATTATRTSTTMTNTTTKVTLLASKEPVDLEAIPRKIPRPSVISP